MNYIRGAVNAISAPYQYYKDLPPINPSTLTGAIDVIVIQRPTSNGDTELVCSPFHVRFGKWKVLRPGEREVCLYIHLFVCPNQTSALQVNVSVNGHPMPYNMKIGEAGEAFFVFETEDEVPDDLITSPLLQPTRPDEVSPIDAGVLTDNLDTIQGLDEQIQADENLTYAKDVEQQKGGLDIQEPEFLDLDALPSPPQEEEETFKNVNTSQKPPDRPPFSRTQSQASISQPVRPAQVLPSPPLTPTRTHSMPNTEEMLAQDKRVDEAIKAVNDSLFVPEVGYHHG